MPDNTFCFHRWPSAWPPHRITPSTPTTPSTRLLPCTIKAALLYARTSLDHPGGISSSEVTFLSSLVVVPFFSSPHYLCACVCWCVCACKGLQMCRPYLRGISFIFESWIELRQSKRWICRRGSPTFFGFFYESKLKKQKKCWFLWMWRINWRHMCVLMVRKSNMIELGLCVIGEHASPRNNDAARSNAVAACFAE